LFFFFQLKKSSFIILDLFASLLVLSSSQIDEENHLVIYIKAIGFWKQYFSINLRIFSLIIFNHYWSSKKNKKSKDLYDIIELMISRLIFLSFSKLRNSFKKYINIYLFQAHNRQSFFVKCRAFKLSAGIVQNCKNQF